mmetsp:Transcript_36799/g.75046  ORF Transcript_36799/g.75046 Transcript_36799/m.75046 type:complete len:232 (-) Transcript_36799:1090-1785(-)
MDSWAAPHLETDSSFSRQYEKSILLLPNLQRILVNFHIIEILTNDCVPFRRAFNYIRDLVSLVVLVNHDAPNALLLAQSRRLGPAEVRRKSFDRIFHLGVNPHEALASHRLLGDAGVGVGELVEAAHSGLRKETRHPVSAAHPLALDKLEEGHVGDVGEGLVGGVVPDDIVDGHDAVNGVAEDGGHHSPVRCVQEQGGGGVEVGRDQDVSFAVLYQVQLSSILNARHCHEV